MGGRARGPPTSGVARGAAILAVGVALGGTLVLLAVARIDPGQAGAITAGAVGVLLWLARDVPHPSD